MKRPCVWVSLSAIGGVLLGVASGMDVISLGVILTLMALAGRRKPHQIHQILVLGVVFTLFFVRVSLEMDQRMALNPISVTGEGQVVARHTSSMELAVLEPAAYKGIHVTLWTEDPYPPATVIRFTGSFLPLKRAGNPGGRDELLQGAAQDLWYQSDQVQMINAVEPKTGMRVKLATAIERDFPTELQGLVSALILADRSDMDLDQQEAIRALGISHLMAISGFHFVLLMFALRMLFKKLGASPWFSDAVGLVILWAYGGLIGFPIAALRALLLMTFVVGGQISRLRVDRINLLFAAVVTLLMIEPFSLFSVGFQLSVTATLSLLVLPNWIRALVFPTRPRLGKALAPILAVQVGIFPLLVRGFGQVSLLTLLGNLLLVPVFIGVMVALFIWALLALGGLSHGLAPLPVLLLRGWIEAVSIAPAHIQAMVTLRRPSWFAVMAYYACLGFFYQVSLGRIRCSLSQGRWLLTCLVFALLLGVMVPRPTRFWVLDVGQGDALLLTKGSHGILWDAGGSPFSDWEVGRNRVEPALDALGIGGVDLGICTHFDADHVEGMVELVEDDRVARIALPPCQADNPWRPKLLAAAKADQCFQAPERLLLQWGKGISIWLFAPYCHKSENNNSLLTRLQVNGTVLWLTGDMEATSEREWLGKLDLKGDILKVAHHGSSTSTTAAFLAAVHPEIALISVGKNSYGHPAKDILQRLGQENIDIYRTDQEGALEIRFNRQGYEVIPFRRERLSFWQWIIQQGPILGWLGVFLVLSLASIMGQMGRADELSSDIKTD